MATRALIGYLNDDGTDFVCTYNHYDGYPDGLGKALENFYNDEDKAESIASTGYISSVDWDTGEIDSKYKEEPNRLKLSGNFDEEDMLEIAGKVDEYGGDYGYVWFEGKWHVLKNRGIRAMAEDLEDAIGARTNPDNDPQSMEEEINENDYNAKWQEFINENRALDNMWAVYVKSLVNDIRLNGVADYADFKEEDFVEDYENYMADKMDS